MAFSKFQNSRIIGIVTALPSNRVESKSGSATLSDSAIKLFTEETGILATTKSAEEQTASDLGFEAAQLLCSRQNIDMEAIGVLIFVSKTPDYRSPATAIVLQSRLGLSKDCLAYDCNVGGSGFHYGLQIATSHLSTVNKKLALLIVGDTTSKQIGPNSLLQLEYGDACSAVLIEKTEESTAPFQVQSNSFGEGYQLFKIDKGGYRNKNANDNNYFWKDEDLSENNFIESDSAAFRQLAVTKIPDSLNRFLTKCGAVASDFDLILFPQENLGLLEVIAEQLQLPLDSIKFDISQVGNLAGATIPYLIGEAVKSTEKQTLRVLSCNYGEGFSWGFSDFTINMAQVYPTFETADFFSEGSVTHEM